MQVFECSNSSSNLPEVEDAYESSKKSSPRPSKSSKSTEISNEGEDAIKVDADDSGSGLFETDLADTSTFDKSSKHSNGPAQSARRTGTAWGRAPVSTLYSF